MKVGFIGLGRMGSGMARRILDGGHELVVYDAVASFAFASSLCLGSKPMVERGSRLA